MDLGDVVLLKLAGHPGESLPDWLSGASLHPVDGTNACFQSSLLLISCSLSPATPDSCRSSSSPSTSTPFSEHHTEMLQTLFFFSPPMFPCGSDGKISACNEGDPGDLGSIPELGRSPGEGNGKPLQYSGLENPMDRGALGATAHGLTKSET